MNGNVTDNDLIHHDFYGTSNCCKSQCPQQGYCNRQSLSCNDVRFNLRKSTVADHGANKLIETNKFPSKVHSYKKDG